MRDSIAAIRRAQVEKPALFETDWEVLRGIELHRALRMASSMDLAQPLSGNPSVGEDLQCINVSGCIRRLPVTRVSFREVAGCVLFRILGYLAGMVVLCIIIYDVFGNSPVPDMLPVCRACCGEVGKLSRQGRILGERPAYGRFLALSMQNGWLHGLLGWLLLAALTLYLRLNAMLDEPLQRTLSVGGVEYEGGSNFWLVIAGGAGVLGGLFLSLYFPLRRHLCFLDIACVHQGDAELLRRGISNIGGCLSVSHELQVLYHPTYFTSCLAVKLLLSHCPSRGPVQFRISASGWPTSSYDNHT